MKLFKRKYNFLLFLVNKIFISTLLIFQISNSFEIKPFHCVFDLNTPIPKKLDKMNIIHENSNYQKSFLSTLDESGFKDFNIYVDTINLEKEIIQYNLQKSKIFI